MRVVAIHHNMDCSSILWVFTKRYSATEDSHKPYDLVWYKAWTLDWSRDSTVDWFKDLIYISTLKWHKTVSKQGR